MGHLYGWFKDIGEKYPTALGDVTCGADCGPGWQNILEPVLECCEKYGIEIVQIKQKFGGLRVYIEGGNSEIERLIRNAETLSFTICEQCGAPGKLGGRGWVRVRCEPCENHEKAKYETK